MNLAKKSSFLIILGNFLLFIFTTYLLNDYLQSFYVLVSNQVLLMTFFVFLFSAFIFMRSQVFSQQTFLYLLMTILLGWTINFYPLFSDEPFPYYIALVAHFLLPCVFLLIFNTFTKNTNQIYQLISLFSLTLININNYDRRFAPWDFMLLFFWCIFFYCQARDKQSPSGQSAQKSILILLILTFILYIFFRFLPSLFLPTSLPLPLVFQLIEGPSYFLLPLIPIVGIGFLIIRRKDIHFRLDIKDYVCQLGLGVLLFGSILLGSVRLLDIPLPKLLIVATLFYCLYFILVVVTQQQFLARFIKTTDSQKQFALDKKTAQTTTIDLLEHTIQRLFEKVLVSDGICLIWKRSDHLFIRHKSGSLRHIRLSQKLKEELQTSADFFTYRNQTLYKKSILEGSQTYGWLLVDSLSTPDFSILNDLLPALSFTEKAQIKQRRLIPEYLSMYQEQLQSIAYIKEMENVRKELSYYLHDDVLQNILAIKNLSQSTHTTDDEALLALQKISFHLTQMNRDIREKTFDLYPNILLELPFKQSVLHLIQQLQQRHTAEALPYITTKIDDVIEVQPTIRFTVYRILKELINNAVKHAKASTVTITIEDYHDSLHFSVEDDGTGVTQINGLNEKFGLRSISQDVYSLDGTLTLLPRSPKGTTIQMTLPKRREHV